MPDDPSTTDPIHAIRERHSKAIPFPRRLFGRRVQAVLNDSGLSFSFRELAQVVLPEPEVETEGDFLACAWQDIHDLLASHDAATRRLAMVEADLERATRPEAKKGK